MKNNYFLPGDLNPQEKIERLIRVNHAGEYGAKRIYLGQLAILKGNKTIEHMMEQEIEHLEYFESKMRTHKVRPTILQPFWHIAGFALGAATAIMGEKAAMACTVAVEEVIDEHYAKQLDELKDGELKESIEKFRAEEIEHRNIGIANHAKEAVGYELLSSIVKAGSRAAIWLSSRY